MVSHTEKWDAWRTAISKGQKRRYAAKSSKPKDTTSKTILPKKEQALEEIRKTCPSIQDSKSTKEVINNGTTN